MKVTDRRSTPEENRAVIAALLKGCSKVLDLGCGERHHTKHLPNTVWVDLDPVHANDPRVLLLDAVEAPTVFRRMHFDCILLTDVIEHIHKLEGSNLLAQIETMCDRIVVFTPLGELWLNSTKEHDSPHRHRCGWHPEEFEARGYTWWSWPTLHDFGDQGGIFGAFYAWKWIKGVAPTVEEIETASGVV